MLLFYVKKLTTFHMETAPKHNFYRLKNVYHSILHDNVVAQQTNKQTKLETIKI